MIYVGIDWARSRHFVVVLDQTGSELHRQYVKHNAQELQALADRLSAIEPDPAAIRVTLELHDGAVLLWLVLQGYSVFPMSPKSADRARDRYRPAGGKDDRIDAFVLADSLRTDAGVLRQLVPDSPRAEELLSWLHIRDGLVRERTARMQQLRAILAEWCPELSQLCSNFCSQWQRDLLMAFPLQQQLARADLEQVAATVGRKRCAAHRKQLEAILAAPCLPLPPGRGAALAWQVRELVQRIGELVARIKEIEQQLRKLVDSHPRARLVHSLPVTGVVSCATLLAIMELLDQATWQELVARWGVVPVTKQSGNKKSVRRRRGCDHFVCQVLTQFAHCTAQVQGSWAREFYQTKRTAGVAHHTILRQLARQWVRIFCAMWRDDTTYDEALHQTNQLQRRAA